MLAETCYTGVKDQDRIQAAHSYNQVAALEEHQEGHPSPMEVGLGSLAEDILQPLLDF